MNDITEFRGEFSWLSNFYPVDVDEHPDYKDPDSIYEFFEDDKVDAELKIRNLYYDCTSYDYIELY